MLNETVVQEKIKQLNAKYKNIDNRWVYQLFFTDNILFWCTTHIICYSYLYLFNAEIFIDKIQLCFKIVFLLDTEFVIEFFLFLSGLSVSSSYRVVIMFAYDLLHSSIIISSSFFNSFNVTSNFYFSVNDL